MSAIIGGSVGHDAVREGVCFESPDVKSLSIVHAREDCNRAVQLEEALSRRGCTASRLPADIEKDVQWPGTLGAQVSGSDSSHFSGPGVPANRRPWPSHGPRHWRLHKAIVTCVLDQTALLPALQLYPIRSFETPR